MLNRKIIYYGATLIVVIGLVAMAAGIINNNNKQNKIGVCNELTDGDIAVVAGVINNGANDTGQLLDAATLVEQKCSDYQQSKDYQYVSILLANSKSEFDEALNKLDQYKATEGQLKAADMLAYPIDVDRLEATIKLNQQAYKANLESINSFPVVEVPENE